MDSKPAVFVSGDKDAILLNEHYKELSDYCFFEGGMPDGSVNKWRDKDEGNKLARKCGFTIPKTVIVNNANECEAITFDYPIFIKANNSVHGGKSAMRKCETKGEALDFVNGLGEGCFPLQVQEFIEKEYELMFLGCSLYGGKRVICPIANRKIRQYPKPAGLVSYSESIAVRHHEELEELAEKVSLYLKEIEYTGNFSAEFLYKNGVYYFLEINLRNDGTSYISTASGYNLPDMVCRSFTDENVTDEGCVFTRKYYMNAYADVHYVLDGTVNPIEWIKEYKSAVQSHKNPKDTPTLLPIYQRDIERDYDSQYAKDTSSQGQRAIVIGGNHHNTLGLIRGLGREGVKVSLILEYHQPENYVLKSKYVKDYTLAKTEEDVIEALLSRKSIKEKAVLICTSDSAASLVDRHRNELKDYFYLPGCAEQGRLTALMNKETMSELAVECGLIVPKSVVIEPTETNLCDVIFPCITKPIASIEGSKADIAICQNEDELKTYLRHCQSPKIQIQQFINKTMEYQLIGVVNGDYLIPGRSRIITQPISTNTGFLRYEHLDGSEPIAQCADFLKRTGYSGLFSIEFIRDSQGNDYFMEINFRNDGNSICVTEAGVNLPYIWFQSCVKPDFIISNVIAQIREIYVMPEFNEIDFWYSRQIRFGRMVRELRQADAFMEYAPDDPHPTKGKREFLERMILAIIKRPIRLLINHFKSR